MKKKAEFWRELFGTLPSLAQFMPSAEDIISDAMDAAQDRHVLAHAHFTDFTSTEPLTGKFQHVRHKGEKIIYTNYEVTIDQLTKMMAHSIL